MIFLKKKSKKKSKNQKSCFILISVNLEILLTMEKYFVKISQQKHTCTTTWRGRF